jgi:hypothetical protein
VIVTPFLYLQQSLFYLLCRTCDAQQSIYYRRMTRHVCRRQVRVPPHHRGRLPAAHLLQVVQRCAVLDQPTGSGMAQIVPAEVLDPGPFQRRAPCLGVHLLDGFIEVSKNEALVLATLAPQYG